MSQYPEIPKELRPIVADVMRRIRSVFPSAHVVTTPTPAQNARQGWGVQGRNGPNRILVNERISPRCIVEKSANGVRIHQTPETSAPSTPPIGAKGEIYGASDQSLRRARRLLERIDWGSLSSGRFVYQKRAFFFTLTWHMKTPDRCGKREIQTFFERVKRRFRGVSIFWRLEFQARGMPHYHLIVALPEKCELGYMREWVTRNWISVIKEPTALAQDVIGIYGRGSKLTQYLAGYVSKQGAAPGVHTGRCWGFVGCPFPPVLRRVVEVDYPSFRLFIRRVRRWARGKSNYLERLRPGVRGFLFLDERVTEQLFRGIDTTTFF